jgi:hypothetical protein
MVSTLLNFLWSEISPPLSGEDRVKVIRFPSECIPQLFLGLDNKSRRCLLLKNKDDLKISLVQRENISLDYLPDISSNYLVIRLDNECFEDLFDDLIVSIYHQIEKKSSGLELSKEFISTFHKWSEFFDSRLVSNLSYEALSGLMGELVYLRHLLNDANSVTINEVLKSWRGPYDDRTDFVLSDRRVEVKTISNTRKEVRISSEFQLEEESGLGIELAVISVEKDASGGISLKEKLMEIKDCTLSLCGDFSIIVHALKKLGLSYSSIGKYDNIRFRFISMATYDASMKTFPKLVKSSLPAGIKKVKYSLALSELSDYLISEN